MPLTDLQKVRTKIADVPIAENLTRYGDGTAVQFVLPHLNPTTASAYVPLGGTAWSATAATFDPTGILTFTNVISANSAYNLRYIHTTFSDDEVQNFLDEGGSVIGAALAAVDALMFDAVKRSRWMASDGTSYDDTSSQSHLAKMHEIFEQQLTQEAGLSGAFGSWAINQGDWSNQ